MVESDKTSNNSREATLMCSPLRWRATSPKEYLRQSSTCSELLPLVEVIMLSHECGALIMSPCRVHSVIEERKHLYNWEYSKGRSKQELFTTFNGTSVDYMYIESSRNTADDDMSLDECLSSCVNLPNPMIGGGGFGKVFKSIYNNKKAAIKQLHHRRHSSSFDFWSLCAELNAFRLPYSPNVASIFSFLSCGSHVQIVTEFVSGRDLKKFIDDDQWSVDSNGRKRIAFQVASGLAHCHAHRLLHLDVKPSNVLLSEDLSVCKLTDFGCSRVANVVLDDVLVAPDSVSTSSFGTIAYKAPELLKGERPTDRADVYSYALLLYELLSRSAPYQGFHPHAIIFLVASRNVRPDLSEIRKKLCDPGLNGIDSDLILLIEKCWAAEYINRPSAAMVCEFLQTFSPI